MAKLYFSYSAMNAGKSTSLLQVAHNYGERGMKTYLLTAEIEDRFAPSGNIASRLGVSKSAETFTKETDLQKQLQSVLEGGTISAVLVDEAQWLSREQVWQLARFVDEHKVPVMCYGIRTDFQGKLFPGSEVLLAIADELREIRSICHCGRKATMIVRYDASEKVVSDGPQNLVGDLGTYQSMCRRHWCQAVDTSG